MTGQFAARLDTGAGLALRAVEAHLRLTSERQRLALAERNLTIHREFQAQVEDRVGAGAGTEADLLTARSRLADATARRVTARSRLDRAEAAYREVFGTLPADLPRAPAAPALPSMPDAALVATSPRLRAADASVEAARAALEAARAGRRPSLVAAVTGRPRAGGGGADVSADLQFRYDLATGGQREAAVAQAEARLAEAEASRDELRLQILRTLETVRSDQRTGAARLAASREALAANEAAREAAREQFAVGRRTISQLLDAQRDFFAAAEALAEAELDLALSGYAALGLTGDILDVFGVALADVAPGGGR